MPTPTPGDPASGSPTAQDVRNARDLAAALERVNAQQRLLLEQEKRLNEERKGKPEGAVRTLEQIGRVAGVAGGVIQKAIGGGFQSAADAAGTFTSLVSLIPGPIGAAASAVTGVLGAALVAASQNAEILKRRVDETTRAVLSGSRTMAQALRDVRVNALAEEFQNLQTAARPTGVFGQLQAGAGILTRQVGNLLSGLRSDIRGSVAGFLGTGEAEITDPQINAAVGRAARAQQTAERVLASPAFRAMNRIVGLERTRGALTESAQASEAAAAQAQLSAELRSTGASAGEAADAAQRLGAAQEFARAQAIDLASAQGLLAPQLERLARAQRAARQAQEAGAILERQRPAVQRLGDQLRQLDQIGGALEALPGGAAAFAAERGAQIRAFIQQNLPEERPTAALMEGSRALSEALFRAEAAERREDPQNALREAVRAATLQQEALVRSNAQLAAALEALREEGELG